MNLLYRTGRVQEPGCGDVYSRGDSSMECIKMTVSRHKDEQGGAKHNLPFSELINRVSVNIHEQLVKLEPPYSEKDALKLKTHKITRSEVYLEYEIIRNGGSRKSDTSSPYREIA